MRHLLIATLSLLFACGSTLPVDDEFAPDGGASTNDGGADVTVDGRQADMDGGQVGDDANTSCSADLMRDRSNCGFCGHDCLDVGCTDGVCNSLEVSIKYRRIRGLTADVAATYYNAEDASGVHTLVRNPSSGNEVVLFTILTPDNLSLPRQVTTDLGNVYFSESITSIASSGGTRIWKISKTGSNPIMLAKNLDVTRGAIVHSDGVTYWGSHPGNIVMMANSSPDVILIDSTQFQIKFITQDDNNLYWTTGSAGTVGRTAKNGSSNTIFHAFEYGSGTNQVSVDETHLYWKTQDGDVLRILKGGGNVENVASEQAIESRKDERGILDTFNTGIAVADGVVYWSAAGEILAQKVWGGPVRTLIDLGDVSDACSTNGLVEELHAGSSHVYFTIVWDQPCATTEMQVLRIPKY